MYDAFEEQRASAVTVLGSNPTFLGYIIPAAQLQSPARFHGRDAAHREGPAGIGAKQTKLSDAFFGRNAVEFLGLRGGRGNRGRLEHFYARHNMSEPEWMCKVDDA